MHTMLFFRRKLAHRLRNCAARRTAACHGNPTGEDLKVVALLNRLAREAEQLPQALVDTVAQLRADPGFARRFDQVWDALADTLGVLLVPMNATELVQWKIHQAHHEPDTDLQVGEGGGVPAQPMSRTISGSWDAAVACQGGVGSVAHDFTAGLAIVGPMLAMWEVATAIGQARDQAFVASHAATSATVASISSDAGRGIVPPVTETLIFTPVGEHLACRVPVELGNRQADVVGQTLTVVPRSAACEAPLLPGRIGDPVTSMMVGLAFLASGLASLKGWTWLQRRGQERTSPPKPPTAMRAAL